MYLIIKLILKVREYRNILLIDELILNDGKAQIQMTKQKDETVWQRRQKVRREKFLRCRSRTRKASCPSWTS